MANDRAKKAEREAAALLPRYTKWVVVINVMYFVFRFLFQYKTVYLDSFLLWGIYIMFAYRCIMLMYRNASLGISYELYQDVLIIHWIVQILTVYSAWFYAIYGLIPAYFIWQNYTSIRQILVLLIGFIFKKCQRKDQGPEY